MEKKELNKSPFETIKSEKIKLGRFNVVQDEVRVNGNVRPYDYLEMMEGVSILPFHGENIITLREYRYPIRSWQTELPGGLIDLGETPKQAAVRELKEETGYEAEEVISLGYFYPPLVLRMKRFIFLLFNVENLVKNHWIRQKY